MNKVNDRDKDDTLSECTLYHTMNVSLESRGLQLYTRLYTCIYLRDKKRTKIQIQDTFFRKDCILKLYQLHLKGEDME